MPLKIGKNVANTLNEYFINTAEYTVSRQILALPSQDIEISISEIINKHENHISIQTIRNKKLNPTFTFEKTTSTNIRQLILELNSRKPMVIDMIPPKIIKMLNDNICDNIESIANSVIRLFNCYLMMKQKYHQSYLYLKKTIEWRKRITDQ